VYSFKDIEFTVRSGCSSIYSGFPIYLSIVARWKERFIYFLLTFFLSFFLFSLPRVGVLCVAVSFLLSGRAIMPKATNPLERSFNYNKSNLLKWRITVKKVQRGLAYHLINHFPPKTAHDIP
jgi:hypothetical protein